MNKSAVLKPRVSEKSYALSEQRNVYVFEMERALSKQSIAKAVEAQFEVTVMNVNVTNLKGKTKRTIRKGGRPVAGRQNDVKKAYVTLKEGDSIAIFQAPDEQVNEPKPDQIGKRGKK